MICVVAKLQKGEHTSMSLIHRDRIEDAEGQVEAFIPDETTRVTFIHFLADMIVYANKIDRGNWNLNLDKVGGFLRFNVGQEYCIYISPRDTFAVCMKDTLQKILAGKSLDIVFTGHVRKAKKTSRLLEDISDLPDCLAKVPGSIGCSFQHEHIVAYVPYFRKLVPQFIEIAIRNTKILPQMKNAHSFGAIEYLSRITHKEMPNPYYTLEEHEFQKLQDNLLKEVRKMTEAELLKAIHSSDESPLKVNSTRDEYVRNKLLGEYVKRQAKGICQDCQEPAPFFGRTTGEPYLEAHHIIPLSGGGKNNLENMTALCPNCHRKRHYG